MNTRKHFKPLCAAFYWKGKCIETQPKKANIFSPTLKLIEPLLLQIILFSLLSLDDSVMKLKVKMLLKFTSCGLFLKVLWKTMQTPSSTFGSRPSSKKLWSLKWWKSRNLHVGICTHICWDRDCNQAVSKSTNNFSCFHKSDTSTLPANAKCNEAYDSK